MPTGVMKTARVTLGGAACVGAFETTRWCLSAWQKPLRRGRFRLLKVVADVGGGLFRSAAAAIMHPKSSAHDRPMRLTAEQRQRIRRAAASTLGESATVRVFGSRLDDTARGGDLDLFVELDGEPAEVLERELGFYAALQRELGEQRIDIVVHRRGSVLRPIDREALRSGVVL